MNHDYADIISLIAEPPKWWDEHAVPRYCEFSPRVSANIYADEVVLLLIECQSCGTEFKVCMSDDQMSRAMRSYGREKPAPSLTRLVQDGEIHYGDPPNACPGECAAGSTMNSVPVRVLEFWRRSMLEWERVPELERGVWPDWMPQSQETSGE